MLSSLRILTRTGAVPVDLETEQLRGAARQIDDPPVDEGPAVVDPQAQRAAVLQIGHLDDARQRQRLVRRRQLVHVVDLVIRGQPLVETRAIPRGGTGFVVVVVGFRVIPHPFHLVRLDLVDRLSGRAMGMVTTGGILRPWRRSRPAPGRSPRRQAESARPSMTPSRSPARPSRDRCYRRYSRQPLRNSWSCSIA